MKSLITGKLKKIQHQKLPSKSEKKLKKWNKYFVGDIESNNPKNLREYHQWISNNTKNFVVGGFLSWRRGRNFDSYVFFINQKQMWNYLKRIAKQKTTKKVIVWFHNLKFDFTFFIQQIIQECEFENEKKHKMNANSFNIFYQSGMKNRRVLFINVQYEKSARIQIRCSLQLFPNMSLGDLGLILEKSKKYDFKLLKGEIDYQKIRKFNSVSEAWKKDPILMKYLKQDLLILRTVLNDSEFQTIFGNINAYTMPSAVFKEMNEKCADAFLKDFLKKTFQEQDFNLGITSYHGGLTLRRIGHEFSGYQKIYENVYYSDIISSYPFQMWKSLPTKRSYFITEMGWENKCFKKTKPNHLSCAHLLVIEIESGSLKKNMKTGVWHQIWRNDNHEIFDGGYFYHEAVFEKPRTITIWEEEWIWIQKFYDFTDWKTVLSYHFLIEQIESVKNYIQTLFEQKQQTDKKKFPALYYAVKAKINSTYGQLGMNDEVVYKILQNIKEIKTTRNDILYEKNGELFAWADEKKTDPKIRKDVFKASWITSQARIRIIIMLLENQKNWLYSDTDCIFSEKPIKFGWGEKIGNQLGDWSKPEIIKYLKILETKKYALFNEKTKKIECKSAGISGVTINIWLNNFLKQGHDPKCVLNNFNELNLNRMENKKSYQTRFGACLVDVSSKEKPIYECTCEKN